MFLFIDNYDSFTYNLVHYFGQTGIEIEVARNDQITVEEVLAKRPTGVVISPGPATPTEAGISLDLVRAAATHRLPLFGVCLGHQTIAQAFGGNIVRAKEIMHGKMGTITHNGTSVFRNLPSPFEATRYHSLVIEPSSLPAELEVTATIESDGTIMGVKHRELPIHGVQFHPESIRSEHGHKMIENFMELVQEATMSEEMKPLISAALEGPLTPEQARSAFEIIMSGDATPAQTGGFLMILRHRSEAIDEITAAATVMRERANAVTAPKGAMDIVGTGGDGIGTLNISTATAVVVAAAGVPVAKHGNRNLSSKSGAADVLTMSGVNTMIDAKRVQSVLDNVGLAFMMAPMHHPAMKHVMPARTELATRTIFNILGPLTNPAQVKYQLTGAFSQALLPTMARVLSNLGTERAWLVHGLDGTDEISIVAPTKVVEINNGVMREMTLSPSDFGLEAAPLTAILGGEPEYNAQRFRALLDGQRDAYRDAVVMNAAAALVIAGRVDELRAGVAMAQATIDDGAARAKMELLVKHTNG